MRTASSSKYRKRSRSYERQPVPHFQRTRRGVRRCDRVRPLVGEPWRQLRRPLYVHGYLPRGRRIQTPRHSPIPSARDKRRQFVMPRWQSARDDSQRIQTPGRVYSDQAAQFGELMRVWRRLDPTYSNPRHDVERIKKQALLNNL